MENKIYNEIENGHFETSKHNKFQNTEWDVELPLEPANQNAPNMGNKFERISMNIIGDILKIVNLCKLGWWLEDCFLNEV